MSDDVFTNAKTAEALAKSLKELAADQQLAWEKVSVSNHPSPGPITDAEPLFRAFDQPVHFQNGGITPAAFSDAEVRGLSVNRTLHISISDALILAADRVARVNQRKTQDTSRPGTHHTAEARKTVAYTVFTALDVRLVRGEEPGLARRAFGVYDTATENDKSHGDIFFLLTGKQAWRSARSKLYDLAKPGLVVLD